MAVLFCTASTVHTISAQSPSPPRGYIKPHFLMHVDLHAIPLRNLASSRQCIFPIPSPPNPTFAL